MPPQQEPNGLIELYKQAVKNVPLLKYSWILIATICILALAAYFKLQNSDVFFYAFAVIAVSFFGFLFSFLLKVHDKFIRTLLYILISCIVLTVGTAVLGFGSFIIWKKPEFYARWFPNQTDPSKTTISDSVVVKDNIPDNDSIKKTVPIIDTLKTPKQISLSNSFKSLSPYNFDKSDINTIKSLSSKYFGYEKKTLFVEGGSSFYDGAEIIIGINPFFSSSFNILDEECKAILDNINSFMGKSPDYDVSVTVEFTYMNNFTQEKAGILEATFANYLKYDDRIYEGCCLGKGPKRKLNSIPVYTIQLEIEKHKVSGKDGN